MATSQATTPGQWQTSAYVINGSDHPIDLRVRFPSVKVDYGALGDRAARALGTSAYDEGITFHLASRATLPIAHLAAMTAAGLDTSKVDQGDETSGLVLLQADGLPDTIASWHALYVAAVPTTVDANFDGASIASGGVGLMPAAPGAPTELFAVASGGVLVQHALATAEPSACAGNQGESFQWSALAPVNGTLASITTLPGGCLDLELEIDPTADAGAQHLSLCIPSSALPFKVGDSLTITATQEPGPISLRMNTLGGSGPHLIVLSAQPMISDSLLHNHLVPFDCEGDRTDCGAYVVPASLEVTTPGGIVRIPPGGEATIDGFGPSGGSARVLVGRAEQVIATSAECDAGRWLPRTVGDFVIVYGGVP